MPNAIDRPLSLTDYPWSNIVDVDPAHASQRHIDNVELARLFHVARLALNTEIIARMSGEEHFSDQMIVRLLIDFRAEVCWRPQLRIAARIARMGRTSYDIELALFTDAVPAVHCLTVNVWMKDGRPCVISDEARTLLAHL